MAAPERHPYEPCTHPGRHGYTLPEDVREYDFCERCRRPLAGHVGPPFDAATTSCEDCGGVGVGCCVNADIPLI